MRSRGRCNGPALLRQGAVAALLLAVAAVPARADSPACAGYAAVARQTGNASYDPSGITPSVVTISLRLLDRDVPVACAAVPVVLASRNGTIRLARSGDALAAHLVSSPQSGVVTPVSYRLSEVATTELVRNGVTNLVLLQIDSGQFLAPGDYLASLDLIIGNASPQPLDLIVRVAPAIRFVGTSLAGGALSLGEVSNGGEARDRFYYRTNSAVAVTAISDNHGQMVHTLGPQYGTIPYSAYLSGERLQLDRPATIRLDDDGNHALRSEELRVMVAPQSNRFAGQYRDTLTLVFTPY